MESRDLDIKKAYSQLLEFELGLQKQESLREHLGSPYGRAPPFKFNLSSRSTSHFTPNYSSGIGRHPFISPFLEDTDERHSAFSKTSNYLSPTSCISLKNKKLPKIVKIVNNGLQESEGLRNQNMQRSLLMGEMLKKFPSNIRQVIEKDTEILTGGENLFETPQDRLEFNPFLRPKGKNYFFPLEMFYDEEVKINELKFPIPGFSKYNCGDHYEWRPCKILRFNIETGKFFIKWDEKQEIKETSRHTVRFEFENEEAFLKKIEEAEGYRINYEAGIRYLARLELETFKQLGTILFPPQQERRVLKKIGMDINDLMHEEIFDEIRKNYVRGVVEFSFKIEHFVSEAKRIEKPWSLELEKFEKQHAFINKYKHLEFKSNKKKMYKLLLLNVPETSILREIVYRLSDISSYRLYNILIELSSKKQTYEEKKLKWIVKDYYTEVKIKIDKIVKKSFKLLKHHENISDKSFYISQVIFESNLQVSISKSKDELISHFSNFYSVLPYHEYTPQLLSCFSETFCKRRNKYRNLLYMYQEALPEIFSGNLKACIDLLADLLSRLIYSNTYENYSMPAPMLTIQIISRFSLIRQLRGRKFKLFTITKQPEQAEASLFSKAFRKSLTNSNHDDDLLKTLDYRMRNQRKNRKIPLLSDQEFDWYKVDYEKDGLFITPVLKLIEEAFRDLIKAPLKSLERIKSISKEKMLDDKLSIPNSSECYGELLTVLQEVLKYSLTGPIAMLKVLNKYQYLVKDSPSKVLEEIIVCHNNDYQGLHIAMKKIKKDMEDVENLLPDYMNFGILQLDLQILKREIVNNCKELLGAILEEIEKEKTRLLNDSHLMFKALIEKLIIPPMDVEKFVELRDYIENQRDLEDFKPIKKSLQVIDYILNIMEEFWYTKMRDSEEKYWRTKSWRNELEKSQVIATGMIEKLYPHFQLKVLENIKELNSNLEAIHQEITAFSEYNTLSQADYYSSIAKDIANRLKEFLQQSKLINNREIILKFPVSDFSKITEMVENFDKYNKLWEFIKIWNEKSMQWMNQPFRFINSKEVEDILRHGFSLLGMIVSKCQNDQVLISIALIMQSKLSLFEKFLPIIFCLRDKAIQLRHWKEIWKILKETDLEGIENHKMEYQTLQHLLDKEILGNLHPVAEVALRARHENEIENTVKLISDDLNRRIVITKYEECDKIEIVKDINLILDVIREHQLNLGFLLKNVRYCENSKGRIIELMKLSTKTQEYLEDLSKFQEKWKEIYPLFLLPVSFT